MKKEEVEIYSDTSNAVMRHPGREYPGSLVQGDTLYSLCKMADEILILVEKKDYAEAKKEIEELRNMLWDRLKHYKQVLGDHEIQLPFYEG